VRKRSWRDPYDLVAYEPHRTVPRSPAQGAFAARHSESDEGGDDLEEVRECADERGVNPSWISVIGARGACNGLADAVGVGTTGGHTEGRLFVGRVRGAGWCASARRPTRRCRRPGTRQRLRFGLA
jgi:hypothetical protein